MTEQLPIYDVIPQIKEKLKEHSRLVVQAPPGAGKTTALPLELMDEKIIMLEPRRIAARNAAYWMAHKLGEKVGERVGYSVHLDRKVSKSTVIEVVTEGVFLNRLIKDPELPGVSLVIFDEFHERSLDADLSLALCREVGEILREDLKILVMSATLDAAPVAAYLDEAPIITSEGKSYPVKIDYLGETDKNLISRTVSAVLKALREKEGSLLVFLPGVGEIKRVQSELEETLSPEIPVLPLYGNLPREAQEKAIEPIEEGKRKVVLSTSIAESSITIKGIRIVIDSGLIRKPRFNPRTGMDTLETLRVSKASADQRTGRAGRIEPGVSYRLWNSYERLEPYGDRGIEVEDLSSLALALAKWGYSHYSSLEWLTEPEEENFQRSRTLLLSLGAVHGKGITELGERISKMPLHPRLGAMVLKGEELKCKKLAADIAALLSEKDVLRFTDDNYQSDLLYRLEALAGKSVYNSRKDAGGLKRVKETSREICSDSPSTNWGNLSTLLISAYPDRIAKNRGDGLFQLANGSNARMDINDSLAHKPYLVVPALGGTGKVPRIFLAAAVDEKEIEEVLHESLQWTESLTYDKNRKKFSGLNELKLNHLVIKENRNVTIDGEKLSEALCQYLQNNGLSELNWSKEAIRFRDRMLFLRNQEMEGYPDFSDEALSRDLSWLIAYLGSFTLKTSLSEIPLLDALKGQLDWNKLQEMDVLAPTHLVVPSGSKIPIDYSGQEPVLKVRLQEMFGMTETPLLCRGKCALTIHLLSPASRPIQVTRDLKSFWDNTYIDVKKDLMGRYPKHYWPENPYEAVATNRTKKRM